ncbi:hypothetical protein GCM10022215_17930 [Nocardioides fonticola]|uniref:Phage tail protein n=1 Tax=Nocardioides fonticola TaxID=450363 RepID=A0ABP7XHK5_9ACTN
MTSFSQRVVAALGEAYRTAAGPLLEDLVTALTAPIEDTDNLLTPFGSDPWARFFDLDVTTDPAWLGQVIGTVVPPGLTNAEAVAYIRQRSAWKRGTPAAMTAAITPLLVGNKRVTLFERDGSPWRLRVMVFTAELAAGKTLADVTAAAETQRPIGIVLTTEQRAGVTYSHLTNLHGPTFAAEATAFPNYSDAINHLPETGTEV